MMAESDSPAGRSALAPAKREAAALLLGVPFYGAVVLLLLSGWAQLVALAGYGLGAGGWVAWRARQGLARGGPRASTADQA